MVDYQALPEEVLDICEASSAPPRLIAHLTLVHDVASKLLARIRVVFPCLQIEESDVLFGAATHDLGKAAIRQELSEPGRLHEQKGAAMLKALGVPEKKARFAITHGEWEDSHSLQLEDLLVALADNCWKGKRVSDLETRIVEHIALATNTPIWEVFASLDDMLQEVTASADARLAWQAQFTP